MPFKSIPSIFEPDPRYKGMVSTDPRTGDFRQMTFADHHAAISAVKLDGVVPSEVRTSFDRARSAMAYAFFDYELFLVGEVQAFGAFELALKHRLDGHGGPS